jgi:3-phenylpropionate/trans-cinnamate dioxygenase ferredoxin subunit
VVKFVVARADEIPEGARLIAEVDGREVGVFRVRGKFYALLNRCPHLGGPLCRGQLLNPVVSAGPGDVRLDESQDLITCPWHGWEFNVQTGQSYWNPEHLRARKFPVGVETGAALATYLETGDANGIPGPYRAETVPVAVESDYVVVTMRPAAPSPGQH